jgi:hypothetical protein
MIKMKHHTTEAVDPGRSIRQGQLRTAWWQEKQDEVVDQSRCMVAAHDRSLHAGFAVVHQKTVGLLGWATKPRLEARRAETGSGRADKLPCWRTRGRIAGLHRKDAVCGNSATVWWRGVLHDLFAPEGLYHNLSARGSVAFCLARRGLIYISFRVSRQTIHPDCFSFSCSIGLDFSSVCKESDLRLDGSFHGCVDSALVAHWMSHPTFRRKPSAYLYACQDQVSCI